MRAWFVFNDEDSRDHGLYIVEPPEIVKPAERIEYKTIPGRPGSLSFREGADVYDGYLRKITVYHKRSEDLTPVLRWLRGEGILITSNEPEMAYHADISAEVRFSARDNDWEQASLAFFCQPYKTQNPPERPVTLDDTLTLYNPGNITAKPVLAIPALTGEEAQISVNGKAYSFTAGAVTVDCDAEIVFTEEGLAMDAMDLSGGFPELQPGQNTIEATGFDGSITITPRWRWI